MRNPKLLRTIVAGSLIALLGALHAGGQLPPGAAPPAPFEVPPKPAGPDLSDESAPEARDTSQLLLALIDQLEKLVDRVATLEQELAKTRLEVAALRSRIPAPPPGDAP